MLNKNHFHPNNKKQPTRTFAECQKSYALCKSVRFLEDKKFEPFEKSSLKNKMYFFYRSIHTFYIILKQYEYNTVPNKATLRPTMGSGIVDLIVKNVDLL